MQNSEEFARVLNWVERFRGSFDALQREQASTRSLVDSAEYELERLRRLLPSSPARSEPEVATASRASDFNSKLRKPENSARPEWWAVLGLNQ